MPYPKMLRVRQKFERPRVEDIPAAVRRELEKLDLGKRIKPGQSVALTAGSRGIANIPLILQSVARYLKDLGAKPFLVPTMGSHGGGTAEGQRKILESYGITEAFVGAPIRASMEVVSVGSSTEGFPVVVDRQAAEADHIGVVARVKPHTGFHGSIESGILKMMMIGLGKHAGALAYHQILLEYPFDQVVRSVGRTIRARSPIAFGLAIVENAYDETARIEAIRPEDFEPREEELLVLAKCWLAKLPFHEADLLDSHRYDQWLELFTDDIRYLMPVRTNTTDTGGRITGENGVPLFDEDMQSLRMRISRLKDPTAWAETPPD